MPSLRTLQRIVVAVLGGTVLLAGVALLVLPGPAVIVIPAGLALLAMEFAWARRWLRHAKALIRPTRPADDASPAQGTKRPPHRRPLATLTRWWRSERRRLRFLRSS